MIQSSSRCIGHLRGSRSGPLLIVVAGLHGNEPAGLEAARRVFRELEQSGAEPAGDFVVLAGNLGALGAGRRYLDRDMNRGWNALPPTGRERFAEDQEQLELAAAIEEAAAGSRGECHFLDLHTTSAGGVPFLMIRDTPAAASWSGEFGLPVVLGLLERVDGVLLEYMRRLGFTSVGVEGGCNDDPAAVDNHEAVLWLALVTLGLLPGSAVPRLEDHRRRLSGARGGLPLQTRITHRHAIAPGDEFRMEPGFRNIQKIGRGELLARDRNGEIRASEDCVLLMPLYQAQGDDGFFLGDNTAAAPPPLSSLRG